MDPLRIVARVLFAYVVLLVLVHVGGKRIVRHATPFDFVLSLILGDMMDDSPATRERIRTTSEALRARAGSIEQVEGKPGAIDGVTATATAVITTERAGEITMAFALVR